MKGMIYVNYYYNPCYYPYFYNAPVYNPYNMQGYRFQPYPYWGNMPMYSPGSGRQCIELKDYGPEPFVVNIEEATKENTNFRTALWTGCHLQLTLMSIDVGEDIGLEKHPDVDQFIRIEEGQGLVMMGDSKDNLCFKKEVYDDYAILIPAGTWHNVVNTGCKPLKLYSIYAPPEHPRGTIHETKEDAEEDHHH
ncbi:cupin domain-containing protein [Alkaliphilus serpentinus]|uniref:Cupin domain-containing protein n=2 Tax=Alkaliphilus serpentinus TaxID=1482731 RepID=A0A833M8X9_9FIRM|nr:cupin domain-containing protein [Alkaliphilus serpentinus]